MSDNENDFQEPNGVQAEPKNANAEFLDYTEDEPCEDDGPHDFLMPNKP